jgi:hypothetical protein
MRGVIFLDYKFCLTINSKLGTARLAREWLARRKSYLFIVNRKEIDLSILPERLRRPNSPLIDGDNIHINTDSAIRHNREWLRLAAQMRTRPAFHLQNIIAWRQLSTIISVLVRD